METSGMRARLGKLLCYFGKRPEAEQGENTCQKPVAPSMLSRVMSVSAVKRDVIPAEACGGRCVVIVGVGMHCERHCNNVF